MDYKFVNKDQVFVLDPKRAVICLLIVFTRIVGFKKLGRFCEVVTLRNYGRAVSELTIFKIEVAGLKMDRDRQVQILDWLLSSVSLLIIFIISVISIKSLTRNITLLRVDVFKYLEHVVDHQNRNELIPLILVNEIR